MSQNSPLPDENRVEASLIEQHRAAVAALDQVLGLAPNQIGQEIDEVERKIVHLRDELIERLRRDPHSPNSAHLQALLERANAVLSLVIGCEYPVGGIHWSAIKLARR